MKQLTLLVAALMLTGATFAQDKACCKKKGAKCSKEACCKKKGSEKDAPKKDSPKETK
jgi:hypothetical protein